uniref:Uncharacterized protein n=1 Tax=Sphingobacterium sp. (strain 21) TaxID=743722 RepID=F4C8W0_SPHS2
MEKISVSNIIEFGRKKTPASKLTLINNLRKPKKEDNSEGGGNYWIHSLSTINSTFVSEDNNAVVEKIDILIDKIEAATAKISKDMFQRNINILYNFEDFEFAKLKPTVELSYLSKPNSKSIITIKGLPLQVLPTHVFTFKENDTKKIGTVWFVAKLGGYQENELAIFTDVLFRYLKANYANEFEIDPKFCISMDVTTLKNVAYNKILNGNVASSLTLSIDSIKALLR